MNLIGKLVLGTSAALLFAGCSLPSKVSYLPSEVPYIDLPIQEGLAISLEVFDDARPNVDPDNRRSQSYVRRKPGINWGLTYEGERFIPVNLVVQNALMLELEAQGFRVISADEEHTTDVNYYLEGSILNFGYEIEPRLIEGTIVRQVTLDVTLLDASRAEVSLDGEIDSTIRQDIAVTFIEAQIEKLIDENLKDVAVKLVERLGTVINASHVGED